MADILINKFPGIAPYQIAADEGAITTATQAHNCNLYQGVVTPVTAPSFIAGGHAGDFVKFNGAWVSGLTRPVIWRYGDTDVLFYKEGNQWKKRVGNATNTLGVARPAKPGLRVLNSWVVTPNAGLEWREATELHPALEYADYTYYLTLSRYINGQEVETAPSNPMVSGPYYAAVQVPEKTEGASYDAKTDAWWDLTNSTKRYNIVSLPNVADDPTVGAWNIYRSDNGDTPQLVSKQSVSETTFSDSLPSAARGRSMYHIRGPLGGDSLFAYVVTWERVVGTQIDESGPSDPVQVGLWSPGVEISRPAAPPTGVVAWNIYRISLAQDPTVAFQLVARLDIGTASYSDTTQNAALGAAITTSYTNPQGAEIIYQPPVAVFDGMAGPHYGMMFGWKGSTLYWSVPGAPDAWPEWYSLEAFGTIQNCASDGAELFVFTTKGVQRGVGTDGDSFFLAQTLTGEGCVGYNLVDTSDSGMCYMSKTGIVALTGSGMNNISRNPLGPEYFRDMDLSTAFLKVFQGAILLFHAGGILRFDIAANSFTTHDGVFSTGFVDREAGVLALRTGSTLVAYRGSTGPYTYTYETGDIVLRQPEWKTFQRFEFFGTGTATASVSVDGVATEDFSIDFDGMLRDRTIHVRHGVIGRAARVKITGTGTLTEIRVSVTKNRV